MTENRNSLELEQQEAQEAQERSAADWFMLGVNAYVHEAYDEAIIFFDHAIDMEPRNARAYVNRGDVYAEKGDCEEALNDYSFAAYLGSKEAAAIEREYRASLANSKKDAAAPD